MKVSVNDKIKMLLVCILPLILFFLCLPKMEFITKIQFIVCAIIVLLGPFIMALLYQIYLERRRK